MRIYIQQTIQLNVARFYCYDVFWGFFSSNGKQPGERDNKKENILIFAPSRKTGDPSTNKWKGQASGWGRIEGGRGNRILLTSWYSRYNLLDSIVYFVLTRWNRRYFTALDLTPAGSHMFTCLSPRCLQNERWTRKAKTPPTMSTSYASRNGHGPWTDFQIHFHPLFVETIQVDRLFPTEPSLNPTPEVSGDCRSGLWYHGAYG